MQPPEQPADAAMSRARLTGRAAILLLVLAVLAVSYASSVRAWLHQRGEINALTSEIAQRKADLQELEQSKRRWHDPAFIKTQARLRFGWVMPGETGYRVIGDDNEIIADGANQLADPDTVLPRDEPEWWESGWGSVVEAGKTPAQLAAERQPANDPVEHIGGGGRHRDAERSGGG